jgi:hypothetical protein
MPAPSRQASDAPLRAHTFACEVPLAMRRAQACSLLARLEATRERSYACLGAAKRREGRVQPFTASRRARAHRKDVPARRALVAGQRKESATSSRTRHREESPSCGVLWN